MNATEAINSIVKLLGLQFKSESFASTMLANGETEVTNNSDSELEVGQTLYIVSDSTLKPAPAGNHETRDGMVVTLDEESTIIAIASKDSEMEAEVKEDEEEIIDEEEETEEEMVKAKSADGDMLESNTFDVGEEIKKVKEDGSSEPAPDGEYQVMLKDSEGNEVKIRVMVKDGKIVERENVEQMGEKEMMSSDFAKDISDIKESMKQLMELVGSMNGKFKTEVNSLKTDFEKFKKSPERKSVEEKQTYTDSFSDYKLNLIKSLRR